MSLDGGYDERNIFARILRGEAPCHRVHETRDILAFLDVRPQSTGHTLVISKHSRARNLLEVEPEHLHAVIDATRLVALGLRRALRPDGLHVAQFNGGDTGQSVFHLHFHVVPRWKDMPLGILAYYETGGLADPAEQAKLAARIREGVAAVMAET